MKTITNTSYFTKTHFLLLTCWLSIIKWAICLSLVKFASESNTLRCGLIIDVFAVSYLVNWKFSLDFKVVNQVEFFCPSIPLLIMWINLKTSFLLEWGKLIVTTFQQKIRCNSIFKIQKMLFSEQHQVQREFVLTFYLSKFEIIFQTQLY